MSGSEKERKLCAFIIDVGTVKIVLIGCKHRIGKYVVLYITLLNESINKYMALIFENQLFILIRCTKFRDYIFLLYMSLSSVDGKFAAFTKLSWQERESNKMPVGLLLTVSMLTFQEGSRPLHVT